MFIGNALESNQKNIAFFKTISVCLTHRFYVDWRGVFSLNVHQSKNRNIGIYRGAFDTSPTSMQLVRLNDDECIWKLKTFENRA